MVRQATPRPLSRVSIKGHPHTAIGEQWRRHPNEAEQVPSVFPQFRRAAVLIQNLDRRFSDSVRFQRVTPTKAEPMNMNNIASIGYVAGQIRTPVAQVRSVAQSLNIQPLAVIDGCPHYGPDDVVRIAEAIRMGDMQTMQRMARHGEPMF